MKAQHKHDVAATGDWKMRAKDTWNWKKWNELYSTNDYLPAEVIIAAVLVVVIIIFHFLSRVILWWCAQNHVSILNKKLSCFWNQESK